MGTNLKDLVEAKPIGIEDLANKVLFVDAFNVLYQFLTTIRQRDGSPLKTSQGVITSHLMGLFNRTTKLMLAGIKLAFVFDGESPKLKFQERERREQAKQLARDKFEEARQEEDYEAMRKYAARSSRLSPDMIEDAKQLLEALGLPVIQAPGEGEAQAAYLVSQGKGFGVVSEDYDTLLFGVPRLIKGLSVSQRKKERDVLNYKRTEVEIIELEQVLNSLKLNQDQLIVLGILVGTDFNPGGVKGIGPKKAHKLLQEHGTDFQGLFSGLEWPFLHSWEEVFKIFKESNHTEYDDLKWEKPDLGKVQQLLVKRYEFSESSVTKKLDKLGKQLGSPQQQSLGDFI